MVSRISSDSGCSDYGINRLHRHDVINTGQDCKLPHLSGVKQMEKFEALADLIRTLSKRCEEAEYHKRQYEQYQQWYREQRDETDRLREILKNSGVEY